MAGDAFADSQAVHAPAADDEEGWDF
jgi:hypothetical protein